jgi:hypothetical protein
MEHKAPKIVENLSSDKKIFRIRPERQLLKLKLFQVNIVCLSMLQPKYLNFAGASRADAQDYKKNVGK